MSKFQSPSVVVKSELKKSIERLNSESFLKEPHAAVFARATIIASTIALGAFWAWASVTPVYETVTANGTVKPTGFVIPIEHLEGGKVTAIYVDEGQKVISGDPILELDPTRLITEISKNNTRQTFLIQTIEKQKRVLAYDFLNANSDQKNQSNPSIVQDPQITYYAAQIANNRASRQVDELRVSSMRQQRNALQSELSILIRRSGRLKALSTEGSVAKRDYESAKIEQFRLEEKFATINGEIETQLGNIEQSKAREKELVAGFKNDAAIGLADAQAELETIQSATKQLKTQLDNTTIRANGEGVIGALSVSHVQEVIAPGALVAEIVPQSTELFAEVEVSAGKIGGVKEGADAKLKVLTHDYTRFGHVNARVVSISPNSFTREDGSIMFTVRLEFDRNALRIVQNEDASQIDRGINPGMTVTADIRVGQKTVLAYLIKPLRAINDRAFSEG